MKSIKEQVSKHEGHILTDQVWAEKKKLAYDLFPIGGGMRFKEGMYYLINFECSPDVIASLKTNYHMNEQILRFLIIKEDEKRKKA